MQTRTGPQAVFISSWYRSGSSSSLGSLSTARLITCQRTSTGRTFSTSSIQREVIQAQGHSGSNQKSAGVLTVSVTFSPQTGTCEIQSYAYEQRGRVRGPFPDTGCQCHVT